MHRFFLPTEKWNDATLDASESHHALHVLRLGGGARVTVFDGEGGEAMATISEVSGHRVHLHLGERTSQPPATCAITLAQAVPKGKNMELIVQKAVELGAAAVAPILSERTIVHLDKTEASRKRDKWTAIALEACKQCGQNRLPHIASPQTLDRFFATREETDLESAETRDARQPQRIFAPFCSEFSAGIRSNTCRKFGAEWHQKAKADDVRLSSRHSLTLIASLQPDARPIRAALEDYERFSKRRPISVTALIGPEGDFTPAELSLAKSHGAQPVTLGPIILRTETAALYILSVLSYELL